MLHIDIPFTILSHVVIVSTFTHVYSIYSLQVTQVVGHNAVTMA